MNLLEHYIQEVYSVKDVSDEVKSKLGVYPKERLLCVKMRVDCYGICEDKEKIFTISEWYKVKQKGFYMS